MSRIVKAESVAARTLGEETILVPIRKNVGQPIELHTLNEVASFIWETLDSPQTLDSLVDAVTEEFEVDPADALPDIERFLATLRGAGLVEEAA